MGIYRKRTSKERMRKLHFSFLRIHDVEDDEDDEEPSTSLPKQLELDNKSRDENGREVLNTSASPVTVCCEMKVSGRPPPWRISRGMCTIA